MAGHLEQIIDFAIGEEQKFQGIYSEAAKKGEIPSMTAMLNDLAAMEKGHEAKLNQFKEGKIASIEVQKNIEDLKISDYLVDVQINDASTIQDIMIFAMKSEEKAKQLYLDLEKMVCAPEEKALFAGLASEEAKHKNDLEKAYDDNILKEN